MLYIILLHGLGCHPITLAPLESYLKCTLRIKNVENVGYPADKIDVASKDDGSTISFDTALDIVGLELENRGISKNQDEIIIVGQSMGGVIGNNLHKKGWNVKLGIYIGSPLHGANLINILEKSINRVFGWIYKPPYNYLKNKSKECEPPHAYRTISMGWMWSNFDGCVFKNETMMNEKYHDHFSWSDHRTFFANLRLWKHVSHLIRMTLDEKLLS